MSQREFEEPTFEGKQLKVKEKGGVTVFRDEGGTAHSWIASDCPVSLKEAN